MAAGLGFKTFTTGEVLTAADTNGYLMQGVLVFASAAARDAAITSPQEGQCCYLKDTDAVLTYSGAAWVGFDDTNAIQNAIVDAKGDIIAATAADTPARLAVGANDYFLQAASGQATGLQWGGSWSTWTPTLVQGVTVTATVTAARYMKIGKMITGQVLLVATSTGTANTNIKVTLPSAALTGNSFVITGGATIYDASTTLVYPGFSAVVDGTYFQLPTSMGISANGGQYLGNTTFTAALASGDYVAFGFTYEVA
jgi:hypothetical protein